MSDPHYYRNKAAFDRAQAAYDNMSPPEDGPSECDNCHGTGEILVLDEIEGNYEETCPVCQGKKFVDEDGNPFDPEL